MIVSILKSGSKGNATLLELTNLNILIDAGITLKELEKYKKNTKIDIILVTHSHTDHTSGLKKIYKTYNPIIYTRNPDLINNDNFETTYLGEQLLVDNIIITSFNLSHDSDCVGFLIKDINTKNELVYITDTGYINKKILNIISDKNTYIIESNHDTDMLMNGKYPFYLKQRILSDNGHLSNKDCCRYLSKLIGNNTTNIILAHLSENNNTPELAYEEAEHMVLKNHFKVNIYIAKQKEAIKNIQV